MPIDPNIILSGLQQGQQGPSPVQGVQQALALGDLLQQQQVRQQEQQQQQSLQDVLSGAQFGPQGQLQDPGALLNQLSLQGLGQEALGLSGPIQQQQLAAQEAQQQQQQQQQIAQAKQQQAAAQEKAALGKASVEDLNKASKVQNLIGSAAGAVLNAPEKNKQAVLDKQIDRLIDQDIITQEQLQSGAIPLDVTPESLSQLRAIRDSSLSSKQQIDITRQEKEFRLKQQELAATKEALKLPKPKKPLSGSDAKMMSIAKGLNRDLDVLDKAFKKDLKGTLAGIITGTDRKLTRVFNSAADRTGRLRSGGAINKDEAESFKSQIASVADLPFANLDDITFALNNLRQESKDVVEGVLPPEETEKDKPKGDKVLFETSLGTIVERNGTRVLIPKVGGR